MPSANCLSSKKITKGTKVLNRNNKKKVSRRPKCRSKHTIPRRRDYGWCKYRCKNCHRKFSGYGSMRNAPKSPCYKCHRLCYPERVIHSRRHRKKKSSSNHSCTGHNCFNRAPGPAFGICVHPKSNPKVKVASKRHVSKVSSLDSMLIQDDFVPHYKWTT